MLKIGEVAKQFNISKRTLRYWEEVGILESSRMENGYRFYDDENAVRIRQIVLLRKLKLSITSIEKIFLTADIGVAREALTSHLKVLKQDSAAFNSLIVIIEKLIRHINGAKSLEQVFPYLEQKDAIICIEEKEASNTQLSERGNNMFAKELSNVRIVKLPAMTVASFHAESEAPEDDCLKVLGKLVLEKKLHKKSGYRFFGFNNPSQTGDSPVYGYEMWVTIPEDFKVPKPLVKKQFGGGLYASISAQMNEIGELWQLLDTWCKNNDEYVVDHSTQWLEECSMDFETFISNQAENGIKQLDLLEPIKRR